MIKIAPIQSHQIKDAKYIISAVAQRIFVPDKTVQDFFDILEYLLKKAGERPEGFFESLVEPLKPSGRCSLSPKN
jgi:hypothetical protein